MLRHRRDTFIHEIVWKTKDPHEPNKGRPEHVQTLECHCIDDESHQQDHKPAMLDLADTTQYKKRPSEWHDELEQKIENWMNSGGEYQVADPERTRRENGFRLITCERPGMVAGMTISLNSFKSIEAQFSLHDATLPAFLDRSGNFFLSVSRNDRGETDRIHIVVKVRQKFEISNLLLSLTYDVKKKWTDALIVGTGIVAERNADQGYGSQEKQLREGLVSCAGEMWTNPMLLPVTILVMCTGRMRERRNVLEDRLVESERDLGVSLSAWKQNEENRPNWPMDINIKLRTQELHTLLRQVFLMRTQANWLSRYANWLLEQEKELSNDETMPSLKQTFDEIKSVASYFASSIDGMTEDFDAMRGRTQSQIDLLYSVVSQRDAHIFLQVARSTKKDSISMMTFTFITALFLPPSFVAALFSMSMFDFSSGSDTAGSTRTTMSHRFWVFWILAIPLTALTMVGWYFWYGHADRKWQRQLDGIEIQGREGLCVNAEINTAELSIGQGNANEGDMRSRRGYTWRTSSESARTLWHRGFHKNRDTVV